MKQEQKLLNTSASQNKCVKNSQNSQTGHTGQTLALQNKCVKISKNSKNIEMIDMYEEICKKHKFQRKYFLIYSMLFYQKISL